MEKKTKKKQANLLKVKKKKDKEIILHFLLFFVSTPTIFSTFSNGVTHIYRHKALIGATNNSNFSPF